MQKSHVCLKGTNLGSYKAALRMFLLGKAGLKNFKVQVGCNLFYKQLLDLVHQGSTDSRVDKVVST